MAKEKMAQARQLIEAKDYDGARKILKTVNHPTAREWEARIDKLAAKKASTGKQPTSKSSAKGKSATRPSKTSRTSGASFGRRMIYFMGGMTIVSLVILGAVFLSTQDDDTNSDAITTVETLPTDEPTPPTNDGDGNAQSATNSSDSEPDNNEGESTTTIQVDRDDPLSVARAFMVAVYENDPDTALSLLCETSVGFFESAGYGVAVGANIPGAEIDAAGLEFELTSQEGDVAVVDFSGEVRIHIEVNDSTTSSAITPGTVQLRNNDGWEVCPE